MPAAPFRFGGVLAWAGALLFPFALFIAVTMPGEPGALQWLTAMALALLLPVQLARRSPLAALVLVLVSATVVLLVIRDDQFYGRMLAVLFFVVVDVMVAGVAVTRPRRTSVPVAVLTALTQTLLALAVSLSGDVLTRFAVMLLAVVTAWVTGDSIRQRRRYAAARREQAEARAVQAERLRIARELHDMVAHSIAVIAVQAGVGRRVIDTQPAEARNTLANIEETSRDTAAALRRMLGTLRRTDAGSGAAPRDPAPGLADLDDLVARSAQAGVAVCLKRHGTPAPLPPDLDLSAFRIVQEAVTNVIKHAGTESCDVAVRQDAGTLTIEITDSGRGSAAAAGNGITGMRERVSLLGGEFGAGSRPEGGFRVTARIPLPEGAR